MLLSEWRRTAPNNDALGQPVLDVLMPVLADLGADDDPECWVNWGDDPEFKYSVLAPTVAGLIVVAVRLSPGVEGGQRATAKLIRWSKLQVGEVSIDSGDGRRIVAIQLEGLVLKGTDDEAGRICEFVRGLLAGIDGRAFQAAGPAVFQALAQAPVARPVKVPAKAAVPEAAAPSAPPPEAAAEPEAAAQPEAALAGKGARKPAAKGAKPQPAWVAPHPIAVPEAPPVAQPVPGRPALPAPPPPAPGHAPSASPAPPESGIPPAPPAPAPSGPREVGSVWEVPAPPEPAPREPKKQRTWTP